LTMKKDLRDKMLELLGLDYIRKRLDNQFVRDEFILTQLSNLPTGSLVLDAGCGSQRYRKYCRHLKYKAQDFGQYTTDEKRMIGTIGIGGEGGYEYGQLDYIGDIWDINEKAETFDAILCTEVFEHIPYPNDALKEFSRLLKANGALILTAPSNCLRHMDPYFFYSGFSDRWYEALLVQFGFKIEVLEPVGDYYSWLAVEVARTAKAHSFLAKIILLPAFVYYFNKKRTTVSRDTLCMGYHVVARKMPKDS
jgi:SAM-dependent methyltransferase